MNLRKFNNTGRRVSEIGLGAWQLGGGWGEMNEETAMAILETAVDENISFFDTADVYGGGKSEERIGRFLRENKRREIFVATKSGRGPDPGGAENLTLDIMRRHTEDSIRRLGVEALDLTQLHCVPKEALQRGEVFDHLETLREEGLIREFGASVESMEEALICLERQGLASLQIIFNIFRQKPSRVLFEKAQEKGVALIVRLPLASGLLAGKFTKESSFSEEDHRHFNRDGASFNVGETFAGLPFERGVELADALKSMVPEAFMMAQWAQRWILDHEAVTTVITGASRPKQVQQNAAVSEMPALDASTHESLRRFYEENVKAEIRGPY